MENNTNSQYLAESQIKKLILDYQAKNGFSTTFDFILEGLDALKAEIEAQAPAIIAAPCERIEATPLAIICLAELLDMATGLKAIDMPLLFGEYIEAYETGQLFYMLDNQGKRALLHAVGHQLFGPLRLDHLQGTVPWGRDEVKTLQAFRLGCFDFYEEGNPAMMKLHLEYNVYRWMELTN